MKTTTTTMKTTTTTMKTTTTTEPNAPHERDDSGPSLGAEIPPHDEVRKGALDPDAIVPPLDSQTDLEAHNSPPGSPRSMLSLRTASPPAADHAPPPSALPPLASGVIVLAMNFLLNVTFFIIVPTSASYANDLGASTWFSGLTIGISTFVAGIFLVPFSRRFSEGYKVPFLFSTVCFAVGEVVYALAGRADTAWLMFVGRVILGAGFVSWMFVKRYMTDPRVVGTARRTMMSALLVTTQAGGMAVGPFVGGLLSKRLAAMTERTRIWNGFTASGWIMAGVWLAFCAAIWLCFEEPPQRDHAVALQVLDPATKAAPGASKLDGSTQAAGTSLAPTAPAAAAPVTLWTLRRHLDRYQLCSVVVMCWFSMVNFLVLGAWESNIPVFGRVRFGWSEYDAGNIIALGGIATLPILFGLVFVARYVEDRHILAAGLLLGMLGLSLHLGTLHGLTRTEAQIHDATSVTFGSFFTAWFLVALGYNMLTTITVSLLSKQIPPHLNGLSSLLIQLSNYSGRISGAFWGTTVFNVGQLSIVWLELAFTVIGTMMIGLMWRRMAAQKG
ncbi:uncharacterized protein PFL1_04585 [Pseudozyma flocculosa PF-1]|uniref:Major facilitator superfamily (MFS) profile domain-containing protein n=2 Tax=Pseudozyma flocculosa TaxID=84751 RepID=A0A5C3F9E0_9BASI|nr:uncharacterized protein PFL1_04585 [Pseudozyma flocculosa PF-1]EPQ27840.1 hypothetical protein PFL1_04585 [Pseudozyma flocculosa PF-1]SPO41032.1 uncharacterized protein PSFLO_06514 [Pseudozyma flocculosa]